MSTHDLAVSGGVVVKRFRSYARGEHVREWRGLSLLDRYAPGLAPRPISADLDGTPPSVTMSVVPGEPGCSAAAAGAALARLHAAVPPEEASRLPWSIGHPAVRMAGLAPASAAARRWLGSAEAARLVASSSGVRPVLGREDHHRPNFLDDAGDVRLVDFEDSGRSDRAVELAALVEHVSWHGYADATDLAGDLDPAERARFRAARRYYAILWSTLLPGSPSERVHALLDC